MGRYTLEHGYKKERRWHYYIVPVILVVGGITLYTGVLKQTPASTKDIAAQLSQPASTLAGSVVAEQLKITSPMPWPSYGQAAYGVVNDGVLAESKNDTEPVPIASLAKVITALAVLEKKPLKPGEQGPTITLTETDIANYEEYVRKDGTVVPIKLGEKITEYQALQAMLLPSANNMSDSLARWAFGSIDEYNKYANKMLKDSGIMHTTIADASGYSSSTKSTATDMVKIGILYMKNPILREIAKQPTATIPFAGVIYNYNAVVNDEEVTGIKVGFTEQAGRTFLVANIENENEDKISVAVVLGANQMSTAMKDAKQLLKKGNTEHDLLPKKN